MDTDRNLLFGVLALQLDLIDRDGFVAACAAWATRKDTPLAEVLLALGLLTPDGRAEVDRLLERRLKKHGDDAQASLAEAADSTVRAAVAAVGDGALAGSLPPTPSPWTTLPTPMSDGPRYAMLRLVGAGGIGRVWLARDGSLGREVALKEPRPDRADPGFWGRFVREAQVTGQLEHPGIVPVYEVGRRPQDNQPFYTMRFVRGRTLKDAVAAYHERRKRKQAGPLELRELLGAFVQVCQAVAYAHSRGVLHRDLKPQNVALGDYGEVMVLDWGLAKVLADGEPDGDCPTAPPPVRPEADQEPTRAGATLGTPQYMAPEQAEGRPDLTDARTDVYGLGAVLYHLLTGDAPFTGQQTREVLDRVRHDPPRRPRELVGETPPALEAVCLKALAKRPEGRYPSAGALAGEVLRWLADEPVTAYRDPLAVRLTRWGRRHRTAVTTGAALLLTTTLALAAGLVAVNAEKERTAFERDKIRAALGIIDAELKSTTEEKDRLERQRDKGPAAGQLKDMSAEMERLTRELEPLLKGGNVGQAELLVRLRSALERTQKMAKGLADSANLRRLREADDMMGRLLEQTRLVMKRLGKRTAAGRGLSKEQEDVLDKELSGDVESMEELYRNLAGAAEVIQRLAKVE